MPVFNKPFDGEFAAVLLRLFFVAEIVGGVEWLGALTDCHGANETRREACSRGFCEYMFSCAGMDLVVFYNEVNMCLRLVRKGL